MNILILCDDHAAADALAAQIHHTEPDHLVTVVAWPLTSTPLLVGSDLVIIYRHQTTDTTPADFAALRKLRRATRYPILLVASVADDATLVQLYTDGVDDHLLPPVNDELLAAKLRVWQRWAARLASVLHH